MADLEEGFEISSSESNIIDSLTHTSETPEDEPGSCESLEDDSFDEDDWTSCSDDECFRGIQLLKRNSLPIILITGVCGFIGSRLARKLRSLGYIIYGLDMVYRPLIIPASNFLSHNLIQSDTVDKLTDWLKYLRIEVVIHLAALIQVGEGQKKPEKYHLYNVKATENVLQAMKLSQVKKIIFSSTAAVYKPQPLTPRDGYIANSSGAVSPRTTASDGRYKQLPQTPINVLSRILPEDNPLGPVSVYGETKLASEQLIRMYVQDEDFQAFVFRFFNVAGGQEIYTPPIHLIPILINKIAQGQPVKIFGKDYPTRDGTCYRDYLHVDDLVQAACQVLNRWEDLVKTYAQPPTGPGPEPSSLSSSNQLGIYRVYNLGLGQCYSVLQVYYQVMSHYWIDWSLDKKPSSQDGKFSFVERREGDPPILLAGVERARRELGWEAQKDLNQIIHDTFKVMIITSI